MHDSDTAHQAMPRVAVVLGPWSGGTSAVTSVVAALGANPHPPLVAVDDVRTPVSGESRTLRRIILAGFREDTLERTSPAPWLAARLRVWAGPGLSVAKFPPLAFFLPEMLRAWQARFLVVHRPAEDIEATRLRRRWPAVYGGAGAGRIMAEIEHGLPAGAPRLDVDFVHLRHDPEAVVGEIADFLDLPASVDAVRRVVRRPAG